MNIEVTLRDIIHNDRACESMGYNPWCIAEGADPNDRIMLTEEQAKEYGFIK